MKSKPTWSLHLWVLLFLGLSAVSCDVINPEEPAPTILHLKPFQFEVQSGQGSAINKIPEVWVYANSSYIGTFAPPVDIYYQETGATEFTFRPGIRNNGLANDAIVYPMFNAYSENLTAGEGLFFDVQPVTSYLPAAVFSLIEDFEVGNSFTEDRDTVAASKMIRSSTDVFEGQYSGQMTMTADADFIEVTHTVPLSGLPADGRPTYLEFRYKNEVEMSIGLLGITLEGQSFSNFFYLIRPTDEWNMLYIELTDFISASELPAYKIIFRSLYPEGSTKSQYNNFLDNIKVVHL